MTRPPRYTPPPERAGGTEYDEPAEADVMTLWLLAIIAAISLAVIISRVAR